jgi:predicted permease
MGIFQIIILQVILPLFAFIGIGALLHRMFRFELNTLSKLLTYFLMPAVGFLNIYYSEITGEVIGYIVVFLILQSSLLMVLCSTVARLRKMDRGEAALVKNSIVLNNSGNFGLAVNQLVFQHQPLGVSIQAVVMVFQTILTNSYGLMNVIGAKYQMSRVFVELAKLPILYAIGLGFILRYLNVSLPIYITTPLDKVSVAFFVVALLTLGGQVAYLKLTSVSFHLVFSVAGRLLLSPCLAFLLIGLLEFEGTLAKALLMASSYPSSRNSAMYALEYDNHPETAGQIVLLTTLLSCMTVTAVVIMANKLY